ncbi:hypothetical protein LCGC14_1984150 [marine sediment metagenome]|uniref:Uncharacterized protein n=1 Tax=marine sediment metagenome TaxID=412755 RepID=A0A0F9HL88_9ZZZZ
MIKRWLKKINEPVPFDPFSQSLRGWIFTILALALFVILSVWADAHAQPELKVGQEVEIFIKEKVSCKTNEFAPNTGYGNVSMSGSIKGAVEALGYNGLPDPYQIIEVRINNARYCVTPLSNLSGYRILKPAPRPEFELPSEAWVGSVRPHPTENDQAIADELRWLRKEIEALKK